MKMVQVTTVFTSAFTNTAVQSQTLQNSTLDMLRDKTLHTALPVIYLFIFIISTPLNLLSFWLLVCDTKPKSPTIIFACNLALTDVLYSVMLPFQALYHMNKNNWIFGGAFCRLSTILFFGNMHCSILTMTFISFERYLGIVHPIHTTHLRTVRIAALTCIFIWLFVLAVHIPLMINDLTFNVTALNITTCFDVLPKTMFPRKIYFYIYYIFQFVVFFLLPCIIIVCCYISVIKVLLKNYGTEQRNIKKQTIYLIIVVLIVFLICYLPNTVLHISHIIYSIKGKTLYVAYKLSLAMNSLNCCLDPFVYYFGAKEFRRKVKLKLFKCLNDSTGDLSTSPLTDQGHTPIALHEHRQGI
ncbi:P2Y purinoceptor 8-like [Protopterus annectens]|uniref:P2Y purinoceptor 8-like n=1 Tax=Protopterus annectens TaxID=7888 RepID=UPI001CFC05E6|nr:P2Y purinoceptor 8-like [Protopterus annectens]